MVRDAKEAAAISAAAAIVPADQDDPERLTTQDVPLPEEQWHDAFDGEEVADQGHTHYESVEEAHADKIPDPPPQPKQGGFLCCGGKAPPAEKVDHDATGLGNNVEDACVKADAEKAEGGGS